VSVRTRKRRAPATKRAKPAKKSLKGRVTPEIERSIAKYASRGHVNREIAALVSKDHRLDPPLSHVAVGRHLNSTALLPATPPKDEGLTAGELLKREALNLVHVASKFAAQGSSAAYLRSVSTLAALLKTTEAIAASDRKREGAKSGLADLFSAAQAKDLERRQAAPADWLLDAVPRVLAELLEVADALQAVPIIRRAELGRPLVAALETIGAAAVQ
jgi:hypothetical protein